MGSSSEDYNSLQNDERGDKNEKKLKRLHMLLPESEWQRLKELSERRNISVSELIRSAYQELYWPRSRIRALQRLDQWNEKPAMSHQERKVLEDVLDRRLSH
ncbi:MAG: hypothetical protein CMF59_11115 [Leptospiraceae bacterium]|nr:hypothetical protein [Leptospiraceae bacterium]